MELDHRVGVVGHHGPHVHHAAVGGQHVGHPVRGEFVRARLPGAGASSVTGVLRVESVERKQQPGARER